MKQLRGDIKAEKNADTNVIVSSVEKNKQGVGYFGYNFYQQNKDKLKEVKIKALILTSFNLSLFC